MIDSDTSRLVQPWVLAHLRQIDYEFETPGHEEEEAAKLVKDLTRLEIRSWAELQYQIEFFAFLMNRITENVKISADCER